MKDKLHCSFCGKHQDEILILIAGPLVFICDECVDLCVDIIQTHKDSRNPHFDTLYDKWREENPQLVAVRRMP